MTSEEELDGTSVVVGIVAGLAIGVIVAVIVLLSPVSASLTTSEASNGYRIAVEDQLWLVTDETDGCSIALEAIEALREARR